MDIFSETDILRVWMDLLFSPLGLMLAGLVVFRIALDRLLPTRPRRRRAKPSPRTRSGSRDVLSVALLLSGAWIVTGAITTSSTDGTNQGSVASWLGCLTPVSWAAFAAALAVEDHSKKRDRVLRENLDDLNALSPTAFEVFVADLFRRRGYEARVVGGDGDHGVDIVVKNLEAERELVQCKRWGGKWIGEPVVRDFYGALIHDGDAVRGYIVTTTFFSKAAREWAKGKPIDLVDGKKLVESVRLIG